MLLGCYLTLIFVYGLVSRRLEGTPLTGPVLFTLAGMLALPLLPEQGAHGVRQEAFLHMAEVGLVLLLFTDASRTDLRHARDRRSLAARLLSTGMMLTLVFGALGALAVFPALSLAEAGILAAILAPTDAGLGQVIVNSERVPRRIRQALNVEAGLNDGLSVPFLLFFMALSGSAAGESASLTRLIGEQLGLGVAVGAGIGLVGGMLLGVADRRQWIADSWRPLAVVALPLLCLFASLAAGASMFIAAFVAGLAVQVGFPKAGQHNVEFTEQWGQVLNLAIFFLFGMLAARDWRQLGLVHAVYAGLSLTVVRMVPVALALLGTRLDRATVLFMGWFGPRGLASIVLGLVYLEEQSQAAAVATIRPAVMATVLASIFLHGASAAPGTAIYARRVSALPPDAPEHEAPR